MIKKIELTSIIFAVCYSATAQFTMLQTPCSSTSQGTAGNITISYTIGEMVLVDSKTFSNFIITQGIVQPEINTKSTTIDYGNFLTGEIQIYPNPTPDVITLQIGLLKKGLLNISLFDVSGKQILADKFDYTGFTTKKYNLSKYAAATYILKIEFTTGNITDKRTGSFKIIKTN